MVLSYGGCWWYLDGSVCSMAERKKRSRTKPSRTENGTEIKQTVAYVNLKTGDDTDSTTAETAVKRGKTQELLAVTAAELQARKTTEKHC